LPQSARLRYSPKRAAEDAVAGRKDDAERLAQEYLQLQKTVEDFDGRSLTIKAWSVTLSTGGLALAAYEKGNVLILFAAAATALGFWIVDWVWKLHQRAFYPRIEAIEAWFAGETPPAGPDPAARAAARPAAGAASAAAPPAPFQIARGWRDANDAPDPYYWRRAKVFWYLGVCLPHIVVIVLAGIAALWFQCHPPDAPREVAASMTLTLP
jgi:hypothetical protein